MDVLNGLHTEHNDITSLSQTARQLTSESQILPTTIVRLIPFRHNPLLLYPTGGYQQSIGTFANYVSVGDRWFITSPYLQSLRIAYAIRKHPVCAYGYAHRHGRPVRRHA
jgi:hypothetical protein